MKILFHSVNGIGLGHLNRTTAIAQEIDEEIIFATNAMDTRMIERRGFEFYKISDKPYETIDKGIVQQKLKKIIIEKKPDIIVYDTFYPYNLLYDKKLINIPNVLLLRMSKDEYYSDLINSGAFEQFTKIIIPHNKDEFIQSKTNKEIKMLFLNSDRVYFTNPIVRRDFHNILHKQENIISIITGGGGEDLQNKNTAFTFVNDNINLIKEKYPNHQIKIFSGPYRNIHDNKNVIFSEKIHETIAKSNFLIVHAGYNILNEICYLGIPGIIIPNPRYNEDQYERAKWFEKNGYLVLNNMTKTELSKKLDEILNISIKRNTNIGNKQTANLISDSIGELRIPIFNKCNNNCSVCDILRMKPTLQHKKDIFNKIHNYKIKNKIILYGGNPLIKGDLFDFIKYAKSEGFRHIEIQTNGGRLKNDSFIKQLNNLGVDSIYCYKFSNHNGDHAKMTNVQGSYDNTMIGLKKNEELGIKTRVVIYE